MPESATVSTLPPKASLTAATVLSLALQALSARILVLIAMSMTFGLFAWGMERGDALSLVTAAVFALLVFLPVYWRGHAQPQ